MGKGSGVTRVTRIHLSESLKLALLAELKRSLGRGGTLKEDGLELQGDCRESLERELAARGYKVKRV